MGQTVEELALEAGLDPDQVARVLRALQRPRVRMVTAGRDAFLRCAPMDDQLEARVFAAMIEAALD